MIEKKYYVIQNGEGDFFGIDDLTGGYPFFTEDCESCKKFYTIESINEFLNSEYTTNQFAKKFADAKVVTIVIKAQQAETIAEFRKRTKFEEECDK